VFNSLEPQIAGPLTEDTHLEARRSNKGEDSVFPSR
jgi:hypothetical protein